MSIEPGSIKSSFSKNAAGADAERFAQYESTLFKDQIPGMAKRAFASQSDPGLQTAEIVARTILDGLEQGHDKIICGGAGRKLRIIGALHKCGPAFFRHVLGGCPPAAARPLSRDPLGSVLCHLPGTRQAVSVGAHERRRVLVTWAA